VVPQGAPACVTWASTRSDLFLGSDARVRIALDPIVGLELEHDSPPGTVVFSAATVSRDLDHVFHVPLTDPETLPSSTGGYFWRLEGSRNTLVLLKNMTGEPQRYVLTLRHPDGVWSPGLQTLEPNQSTVWDIGALRSGQVPDATGRTIPMSATMGQVQWSIGGGRSPRGIVGRIEQVDYVLGVSATYACPQPTNDMFDSAGISPSSALIQVGYAPGFEAWEVDVDAWENPVGPYEITEILDWDTGNPSVADIVGYPAYVGGVANGSTSLNAYGESNGWVDIENTEHAWISEFASIQVQQCPNDATRSTIVQDYVDRGVGWKPDCSDLTSTLPSLSHYTVGGARESNTWNVSNTWSLAVLDEATVGNTYCIVANYGSVPTMTSGYRTPFDQVRISGTPNNWNDALHVFGKAADLDTPSNPNNVMWQHLKDIAKGGSCGSGCVEPRVDSPNHFHVDFRGTCPSGY
jgi:hypothetical protein